MPLLIDGHNLIGTGALPGISLADEYDEMMLVRMLRRYRSRVRSDITVFFDGGIPGGISRGLTGGGVSVVFAPSQRHRADDLIIARLRGAVQPRGLTVVTSDSAIAATAGQVGARVISSAEFAERLLAPLPAPRTVREEPLPSTDEIDQWLDFFGLDQEAEDRAGDQAVGEDTSAGVRAAPTDRRRRKQLRGT